MNKLLKDAIADAKAVRETALANAKLALEEAFAPKLQSMLSSKIREEMDEEEGLHADENELDPNADRRDVGHEDHTDDIEMESRFKSLAGISEEEGEEESEEDFSDESEEDFSDEGGEEEFSSDESEEDYSDESDEDLEEILRELDAEVADEQPAGEGEDEEWGNKDIAGHSDEMAEDIDLDEIINALREEEGEEEAPAKDEEEVDLKELLNSLNEEEEEEEEEEEKVEEGKMKKKMNKMEEELNEAYSAVKFLRNKLSEVNLLNAKLLYVNKLFRNNLTETQKVKIIETFDRAKTVREAKLVFATLSESFSAAKGSTKPNATKKSVMESFASKATAKTKSVLTEGNDQANRFKKLAGII